jgi:hypothetical protein
MKHAFELEMGMKLSQVAVSSLGLPAPWLVGLGEQVVVSRVGEVLRIESTRVALARSKLRRMTNHLQATAAQAGMTDRVIADEVKAVRKARAQRALRS